jgi:hypothetical protein
LLLLSAAAAATTTTIVVVPPKCLRWRRQLFGLVGALAEGGRLQLPWLALVTAGFVYNGLAATAFVFDEFRRDWWTVWTVANLVGDLINLVDLLVVLAVVAAGSRGPTGSCSINYILNYIKVRGIIFWKIKYSIIAILSMEHDN